MKKLILILVGGCFAFIALAICCILCFDTIVDRIDLSAPVPQWEEMIGTYEAEDGAMIVLKEDSTIVLLNIDWSRVMNKINTVYTAEEIGKWQFNEYYPDEYWDYYGLEVSLRPSWIHRWTTSEDREYINIWIEGERVLGYFPPWTIYTELGDPDEMNRYYFKKIK